MSLEIGGAGKSMKVCPPVVAWRAAMVAGLVGIAGFTGRTRRHVYRMVAAVTPSCWFRTTGSMRQYCGFLEFERTLCYAFMWIVDSICFTCIVDSICRLIISLYVMHGSRWVLDRPDFTKCSEGVWSTKSLVASMKYLVPSSKYQVPGTWYQVFGTKYLVVGTWYQVPSTWYVVPSTLYLLPSTWFQVGSTRYPVLGPWYQVPSTLYLVPSTWYLVPSSWYLVLPSTW